MATSLEMKNKLINKEIIDYHWDNKNKRHVIFLKDGSQEVLFGRQGEYKETYDDYEYVKINNDYQIR